MQINVCMEKKRELERDIERKRGEERTRWRVREIHTIWSGKQQQTIQQGKGWVNAKIG